MERIEPKNEGRLRIADEYPKTVYFETMVLFFGSNFLFHQNVFRRAGSRPQFAMFMLVNAFTSLQIAECCNYQYLRRQATLLNNTREMDHRANLNGIIRTNMLNARMF